MTINTLIVVQSIIIAGLLSWAQLWAHTYDIYVKAGDPIWHVSLAMAAIYSAVMFSLLSIILTVFTKVKPKWCYLRRLATASAMFSVFVLLLIIFFSLIGFFPKAFEGWTQWHPIWVNNMPPSITTGIAIGSGIVILFTCIFWLGSYVENIINWEGNSQENKPKVKQSGPQRKVKP